MHAERPYPFRFRVEDGAGRQAGEMELNMGMLGHAAFVRSDRSVFAPVPPTGPAPMSARALTQPENPHDGLRTARRGVQVTRGGGVLTGAFDARVEN